MKLADKLQAKKKKYTSMKLLDAKDKPGDVLVLQTVIQIDH